MKFMVAITLKGQCFICVTKPCIYGLCDVTNFISLSQTGDSYKMAMCTSKLLKHLNAMR